MKINQQNIDRIAKIIKDAALSVLVEAMNNEPPASQVVVNFSPERVFAAVYNEDDMLASVERELKK